MANVVILGKYYAPFAGGIEANTKSVADHLAQTHDVTALVNAHDKPGTDYVGKVKVVRKPVTALIASQPLSIGLLDSKLLRAADVIHFHAPNPYASFRLWLWSLFNRLPPIVTTHHMDIYGRKFLRTVTMPFSRWLLQRSATVIVTSKKNAQVSQDIPQDAHIEAVPLGLDPADYPIDDAFRAEARAWRESKIGKAPAVGFLGRHARYKGLGELMQAIAAIPGLHGLIAGDGPYKAETEALAQSLGIADRVHFLGRVDNRTKLLLLAGIDVFAFPSTEITEAFGVSQMEAMLCETPVVAANLPTGVTDVAIDGETALLVPPGDAQALAEKLRYVLDHPQEAAELARRGRAHVAANMNEALVAQRSARIIEAVIR